MYTEVVNNTGIGKIKLNAIITILQYILNVSYKNEFTDNVVAVYFVHLSNNKNDILVIIKFLVI